MKFPNFHKIENFRTFKNFLIQKIQSLKEKKILSNYLKVIILYNNKLKK